MFVIRTDRRGRRWSRVVAVPLGAVALVGRAACGTGTDASAASGTGASATVDGSASDGSSAMTSICCTVFATPSMSKSRRTLKKCWWFGA